MATDLQKLLNLELPIIQAPMAGVQGSALAIAVSNAGGLGSLPCAMLTPAAIRGELATIVSSSDKPYNVNFFCHAQASEDKQLETRWRNELAPYYDSYGIDSNAIPAGLQRTAFNQQSVELLREFNPAVVSFHFGLPPEELLNQVKALGIKVLCSATTVDEACWLASQGVDAIIAQGLEAGGHRGMFLTDDITSQIGTFALLPQIVAAVDLPVIAAGGIATAAGAAAALRLGASAVQIGTAYLLCSEASTSQVHRAALRSPGARHTALTNRFSGRPARGIVNRLMRELGPFGEVPPFPLAATALGPLRNAAEAQQCGDFSPLWSGQNNSACRECSGAEMTRSLAAEL